MTTPQKALLVVGGIALAFFLTRKAAMKVVVERRLKKNAHVLPQYTQTRANNATISAIAANRLRRL